MRKCTNCGFENSDDNISCVACGFSMSPENFYSEWEITASGYQTQGIYNNNEKEPTNHKRKSIFNFKKEIICNVCGTKHDRSILCPTCEERLSRPAEGVFSEKTQARLDAIGDILDGLFDVRLRY